MTAEGVAGLRAGIDDVLVVLDGLPEATWHEPSGRTGWTVQDVVAHMGAIFHRLVDPSDDAARDPDETAEQCKERPVALRRAWSPADVFDEYRTYAPGGHAVLAAMNGPDLAAVAFSMGDLGTYPMGMLADALCFDHWCHLNIDLAGPAGPVLAALPAPDDLRLVPTINWMLGGLPQMSPEIASVLVRPVRLILEGPGARMVDLLPASDGGLVQVAPRNAGRDVAAVVVSPTTSFVSWATRRSRWPGQVAVVGDEAYAAAVLDAINVI